MINGEGKLSVEQALEAADHARYKSSGDALALGVLAAEVRRLQAIERRAVKELKYRREWLEESKGKRHFDDFDMSNAGVAGLVIDELLSILGYDPDGESEAE